MKTLFLFSIITCGFLGMASLIQPVNNTKTPKIAAKELGDGYSFIPSGSTIIDGKLTSIQSFCMQKNEVSNEEYHLFLEDLKATGKTAELAIAVVDSAKWSSENHHMKSFETYYHSHPAYRNYPVVTISYEAAQLYCQWMTEQVNKRLKTDGKYLFRLPTKEEFIYAAEGGFTCRPYTWKGPFMRNSKGLILCNHLHEDLGGSASGLNESNHADIIAPVKSYWPNEFGIYNLNGNVAEMTNEKGQAIGGSWRDTEENVRNNSLSSYMLPSPTIGFRIVVTIVQ